MNNRIMLYILTSFNLTQLYCCNICCKPNLDDSTSSSNSGSKRNLKHTHSTRGNLDRGLSHLGLYDNHIDNSLKSYKRGGNGINDLMENNQKLFEQRMLELDKKYIMNKKIHEENMRNNDIDHINKMKEMDNANKKAMDKMDIAHKKAMDKLNKEADKIDIAHKKTMDKLKKERIIESFYNDISSLNHRKKNLTNFFIDSLKKKIDRYCEFKMLEERLIGYEEIFNKTYESAKLASEYEIKDAIDFISNYDKIPNYKAVYLGEETFKNINEALYNYKTYLEMHKEDINSFNTEKKKLEGKKAEYLEYKNKLSSENKEEDDILNNLKIECNKLFWSVCNLVEKISVYNDDAYDFSDKYMKYDMSTNDNFNNYIEQK